MECGCLRVKYRKELPFMAGFEHPWQIQSPSGIAVRGGSMHAMWQPLLHPGASQSSMVSPPSAELQTWQGVSSSIKIGSSCRSAKLSINLGITNQRALGPLNTLTALNICICMSRDEGVLHGREIQQNHTSKLSVLLMLSVVRSALSQRDKGTVRSALSDRAL